MRGRYEGMWNVVRFNWPKYVLGLVVVLFTVAVACLTTGWASTVLALVSAVSVAALLLPLLVSHIIYDRSDLYRLPWLNDRDASWNGTVLNINAGFDEISRSIRRRFPQCALEVADFYDPARHTEPSIERARRRYAPFPGTRRIRTKQLPYPDQSLDLVLLFLSLHEVRDPQERVSFLQAIHRILKADGRLIVTEHLRDVPNFIAFNFGSMHFYSKRTWIRSFHEAGFQLERTHRTSGFITTFVLCTH